MHQNGQRLQITIRLIFDYYQNQTNIIAFYIGLNIMAEGQQVIFSENQFLSLFNLEIACEQITVIITNQLYTYDFGTIEKVFFKQQLICIFFLAIFKILFTICFSFDILDVRVFSLQLKQPQPNLINTSFIRLFFSQLILEFVLVLTHLDKHMNLIDKDLVEWEETSFI